MDIGRRLERSIMLANLLGTTCVHAYDIEVENLMLEDLLLTVENLMTYRRRYRSGLQRLSVLKLLLLKEDNPRSLTYQVNYLQKYITQLPREHIDNQLSEEERCVLEASTQLRLIDINQLSQRAEDGLAYPVLDRLLRNFIQSMSNTSNALTESFFSQGEGPQPFGLSTRVSEQ